MTETSGYNGTEVTIETKRGGRRLAMSAHNKPLIETWLEKGSYLNCCDTDKDPRPKVMLNPWEWKSLRRQGNC